MYLAIDSLEAVGGRRRLSAKVNLMDPTLIASRRLAARDQGSRVISLVSAHYAKNIMNVLGVPACSSSVHVVVPFDGMMTL
jgi:hypothetical protein